MRMQFLPRLVSPELVPLHLVPPKFVPPHLVPPEPKDGDANCAFQKI